MKLPWPLKRGNFLKLTLNVVNRCTFSLNVILVNLTISKLQRRLTHRFEDFSDTQHNFKLFLIFTRNFFKPANRLKVVRRMISLKKIANEIANGNVICTLDVYQL